MATNAVGAEVQCGARTKMLLGLSTFLSERQEVKAVDSY